MKKIIFTILLLITACAPLQITEIPATPPPQTATVDQFKLKTVKVTHTPTFCTVIADVLNLRQAPNTGAGIEARLTHGEQLEIIYTIGNWYKVETKQRTGYVYKKYCSASP